MTNPAPTFNNVLNQETLRVLTEIQIYVNTVPTRCICPPIKPHLTDPQISTKDAYFGSKIAFKTSQRTLEEQDYVDSVLHAINICNKERSKMAATIDSQRNKMRELMKIIDALLGNGADDYIQDLKDQIQDLKDLLELKEM